MASLSAGVTLGLTGPAFADATVAAPAPAAGASGGAQGSEGVVLPDIVVTATRQSQNAQRVPIALTAVGAEQLAKEGVTSATQLSQVAPSLFVLGSVSEGSPRFTIRGLTGTDYLPNGSPAVATYVDDVYQASQFGITSGLFDLQRIEILRGPQGTTFGKNTTGGAVAYFSQTPTNTSEGYLTGRLGGGDQSQRSLEGAINVPIVDGVLAMRLSGRFESKGGWVEDTANNNKERGFGDGQSGRFQLRWTPSADTTANLTIFGTKWRGDEPVAHGRIIPEPESPTVVSLSPYDLHDNFTNTGATLRVEKDLGLVALTSISHYRRTKYDTAQDVDGRIDDTFLYSSISVAKQYGQELRIASDSSKRLSGLSGLYYEHDDVNDLNAESAALQNNFNNRALYVTKTNTYAIFGNLKFKITDDLSVIGGLRKTWETRNLDGSKMYFQSGQFHWTQGDLLFRGAPPATPDQLLAYQLRVKSTPVTWDATLNYNPQRSLLLFLRIAKGFRSGGFNPAATILDPTALPAPVPPPYQGESVRSYEAGVKATLFDGMLRANAAMYHYDYTEQQVTEYINFVAITENAGRSKVDGAELELTASPDTHWNLRGSLSYTNARYTHYVLPGIGADFTGNRLVQAPRWTGNWSVSYTTPVTDDFDLRASTTWTYRSTIYFDSANDPFLSDGPLATGNVRLSLDPKSGKGVSAAVFVNNLTNQRRLASGFAFVPGSFYSEYFSPGRTFGLDVSYHW